MHRIAGPGTETFDIRGIDFGVDGVLRGGPDRVEAAFAELKRRDESLRIAHHIERAPIDRKYKVGLMIAELACVWEILDNDVETASHRYVTGNQFGFGRVAVSQHLEMETEYALDTLIKVNVYDPNAAEMNTDYVLNLAGPNADDMSIHCDRETPEGFMIGNGVPLLHLKDNYIEGEDHLVFQAERRTEALKKYLMLKPKKRKRIQTRAKAVVWAD